MSALVSGARDAGVALTRRRLLGALAEMDDHMLRDIGLSRHDVWSAAAEPLFRDPTVGLASRAAVTRIAVRKAERETRAAFETRAALAQLWTADSRAA